MKFIDIRTGRRDSESVRVMAKRGLKMRSDGMRVKEIAYHLGVTENYCAQMLRRYKEELESVGQRELFTAGLMEDVGLDADRELVTRVVVKAMAVEREACAKVADSFDQNIGELIRRRT